VTRDECNPHRRSAASNVDDARRLTIYRGCQRERRTAAVARFLSPEPERPIRRPIRFRERVEYKNCLPGSLLWQLTLLTSARNRTRTTPAFESRVAADRSRPDRRHLATHQRLAMSMSFPNGSPRGSVSLLSQPDDVPRSSGPGPRKRSCQSEMDRDDRAHERVVYVGSTETGAWSTTTSCRAMQSGLEADRAR